MKITRDYESQHVLSDGTKVTLRLARPDDRDELRRGFARLSPESRYRRFLTAQAQLSDEMLTYLTAMDGVDHVAIVALTESLDLKRDVGLGVARFVRLKGEPEVAEAAVTVVDDAQGKGLGRLLLGVLTEAARERDVRVFRAEVLADNTPMRRILEEAGAVVQRNDGDTLVFDVRLSPEEQEGPLDHALRRLLRAVAESVALGRSPQ